jgi:hypothetical protein
VASLAPGRLEAAVLDHDRVSGDATAEVVLLVGCSWPRGTEEITGAIVSVIRLHCQDGVKMAARIRAGHAAAAGFALSAALFLVGCSGAVVSSAGASARCREHRSAYGTLTACPGVAAVGASVTLSGSTFCGAQRGEPPHHALGFTVVFLGPKARIGSGGGGDAVSYKINGNGFRATYRIPSTYLGSEQTDTWGKRVPVRPGAGYMFATYPAAGCQVPFRVTTAAGR